MNTTVNVQSRRTSLAGYNKIITERNARIAEENAAHEKAEQKARIEAEENKRLAFEKEMTEAQEFINNLCDSIQRSYMAMVNMGKEMCRIQNELTEKQQEEELFIETSEQRYDKQEELDDTSEWKMSILKNAYYMLPIIDSIFAFFALRPILTYNLFDLKIFGEQAALAAGLILSPILGYFCSVVSRFAVSSLNKNDKGLKKAGKALAVLGAVFILPMIYIVGEITFNEGTNWAYSAPFAFFSFIIQLIIVTGLESQGNALKYFRIQKRNNEVKAIKQADEQAIQHEIERTKAAMNNLSEKFNLELINIFDKFQKLASAMNIFRDRFKKEPNIYLSLATKYFGNFYVFQGFTIPFSIEPIPSVQTTNTLRSPFDDFHFLNIMLTYLGININLNTTIHTLESNKDTVEALPSNSTEATESSIESGNVEQTKETASTPNEETASDDDTTDDGNDDSSKDVVW